MIIRTDVRSANEIMASPVVSITLQAAFLSALSNLLAQAVTAYRANVGQQHSLNMVASHLPISETLHFEDHSSGPVRDLDTHQHATKFLLAVVSRRQIP